MQHARTSPRWPWRRTANVTPTAEQLQDQYLDSVFSYSLRRLGNRADAEDASIQTLTAACARITHCPRPSAASVDDPVKAWLLGIARHKIADVLRRRRRLHEVRLVDADQIGQPEERSIRIALDGLREEWREALLLKYADGLSLREMAQALGKSEKAVSSLLQRARAAAQASLEDES